MAGVKMNHIPYKGTGPRSRTRSAADGLILSSTATALPHVQSGKLRAIAVTTAKRIPALPNVPTVAESGVPGYEVILWHGLIGPKSCRGDRGPHHAEVTKALKLKETASSCRTTASTRPAARRAVRRTDQEGDRDLAQSRGDAGVKAE